MLYGPRHRYGSDIQNRSMFNDIYCHPGRMEENYTSPIVLPKNIDKALQGQITNKIKVHFYDRPTVIGSNLSYTKIGDVPFITVDEVSYPYNRVSSINIGGQLFKP